LCFAHSSTPIESIAHPTVPGKLIKGMIGEARERQPTSFRYPACLKAMGHAKNPLTIAGYCSPLQGGQNPTGVGQHILQMFNGMTESDRVSFSLLGTQDAFNRFRSSLPNCQQPPQTRHHLLRGTDRATRFLLNQTRLRPIDGAKIGIQWVYCPKEQPVSVRNAKLAVTCHDLRALETNIPGLPNCRGLTNHAITVRNLRQMARRADLILAVSEFTKQRLFEFLDISPDRVVVVGNGISSTYRQVPGNEHVQATLNRFDLKEKQFLVCVGSLARRKGGDALLEIAANAALNRDFKILVAGQRHDADLMHQYNCLGSNIRTRIILPGYINDEDLNVLLRSSLALLFPSRYEGFGIPVIEAMAAGTRVISSHSSSLAEICSRHAVFCDPNEPATLLAAIEYVANESDHDREIEISNAATYAGSFTWRRCVSRLIDAISERS